MDSVPQWVGIALVAMGLVYTWISNGRKQKETDTRLSTSLKGEIKEIVKRLDDPLEGLGAIRKAIGHIKEDTASDKATFSGRISRVEEDIKELRVR